ncbi:hypothetical protein KVT40_004447 [Elsinoe batatas]|uniref:Uncharacterized protein n=1 Tax=Elsinoe batatas TaxID=2601811 RepID=A0A8K0PK85_9PEZI|nr:hypothetical protein KVT40_004447 [Elsinoe batatas]
MCKFLIALKGSQSGRLMSTQSLARTKAACQVIVNPAKSKSSTTAKVATTSRKSSSSSSAALSAPPSSIATKARTSSSSIAPASSSASGTAVKSAASLSSSPSSSSTGTPTSVVASTIASTSTRQRTTVTNANANIPVLTSASIVITTPLATTTTSTTTTSFDDSSSTSSQDDGARSQQSTQRTSDDSQAATSTGGNKLKSSTTASLPFCSSAPVLSLAADPSGTPFCQTILVVPTVTITSQTTSTTTTGLMITNTNIAYETTTITRQITQPPNQTETAYITAYATFCGGGNTFAKRDALPAAQTTSSGVAVPSYLSGYNANRISSACSCLGPLPTPSITRTVTISGPTVTLTTTTDIDFTSTITRTLTSVSYANTSTIPTVTATTTVTDTAAVSGGALATNTLAPSVPGVFMQYPGYTPAADIPGLMSCQCSSSSGGTCDFAGYTSPLIPATSCSNFAGCMASCAYLNSKVSGSNKCSGVFYDGSVGYCTLLGPGYLPMVDQGSCGVVYGNTTTSANVGFAALVRN